jgi:hypothetical protein
VLSELRLHLRKFLSSLYGHLQEGGPSGDDFQTADRSHSGMPPSSRGPNSLLPQLPKELHAALLRNIGGILEWSYDFAQAFFLRVCRFHPLFIITTESQTYQQQQMQVHLLSFFLHHRIEPFNATRSLRCRSNDEKIRTLLFAGLAGGGSY